MSGEEAPTETAATEPPKPPEPPRPPETPDEVAKLRAELEAANHRAEELLDELKRARADYENFQKRVARDIVEIREGANASLLKDLLPVLDDFDHALAALPKGEAADGVRMLHEKLAQALRDAGLEAVDPAGKPFDPFDHEVVGHANDEGLSEGTVKDVVQKGYRFRRRLLRPAKVIVVKRGE